MFYDPHIQSDLILVSWSTFMIFLIDFFMCVTDLKAEWKY